MRPITAFQVIESGAVIALDEDGYLWLGTVEYTSEKVLETVWQAIRGPGDAPPFLDTRSRLDRLEASIEEQVAERDALRKHFAGLPKIGAEPDDESV